ncbi:universal stress protein [Natronococcus sp. JC468]|uniref:universal stress protein n=1 Tax=Natronococcus sp. JC468 TaxID=1961921 RepID=UPI00143A66DE|nr:universal stress protein [Natronococcus sp. JC468]NKE35042.1 universal stress protein [Natronococcus sp. JC468]
MRVVVGTDSVHATAAICDYFERRAGDDDVRVVAAVPPGNEVARRDAAEALNVAGVRLAGDDVETELREGEPASALCEAAADVDADEIVVGETGSDAAGSTARTMLERASRPVVIVPVPDLE